MTTRADLMVTLMLPPANVRFQAPEERNGLPAVFGASSDVWVDLLGPAEALQVATISIALSSPLARGVASNTLIAPVFEAIWPGDAPLMGWYIRSCLALLQPRQAQVAFTYDVRPVQLVCDRAAQRLNIMMRCT